MAQAIPRGAHFKWICKGCGRGEALDVLDYLRVAGPSYSMWNEISECACGAPRTLFGQSSDGTPFMPLKDEMLWVVAEVGYGKDPEAWFEIWWFSDPP